MRLGLCAGLLLPRLRPTLRLSFHAIATLPEN